LKDTKHEFVLSKQIPRSGTGTGANIAESRYAQSKADFLSKLSISAKQASETEYWLTLLHESELIDNKQFESVHTDCAELPKLLTSSINTLKKSLGKE